MRIVVFDQWDKLMKKIVGTAAGSAVEKMQFDVVRIEPKSSRAKLVDRAANILAVEGGTTTIEMPDIVPGKARDFLLRVTATGENTLVFTGAEAFEGDAGALDAPGDSETCVYFFTETAADVLLVARKVAEKIET